MISTSSIGKTVASIAAIALLLSVPAGASATTGIETSVPVRVLLTEKGAVWTPALRKLHPDTDTTFEIKVTNRAAQPHSFRIGYRETRLLRKGASEFLYFTFHLVGPTLWQARHGNVQGAGFHGKLNVHVPHPFTGGG
jgi:hypothetical protein